MAKAIRGEVWLVQFRPAVGAEIQKVRPAIVMNPPSIGRLPLAIVVPVTEWKDVFVHYSWIIELLPSASNGLAKRSGADAFQVKSVSEDRLVEKQGVIGFDEVNRECRRAVRWLCVTVTVSHSL